MSFSTNISQAKMVCVALIAAVVFQASNQTWAIPQAIDSSTEEAVARGLVYDMHDYPQQNYALGYGSGFADLDDDGDPDIILLGSADGHIGIYENDGTGHFIDRSVNNGIPLLMYEAAGFTAGDYDGDGDLDLHFAMFGIANILMRNDGNFQFTDVTEVAMLGDIGASYSASFGDFDNDGWIDLYLCNYNGAVPGTGDIDNKLFRNLGNGTFEEVGIAQTVNDHGFSFQSVWFDYDRDGDLDLYLSNDRGHLPTLLRANQLWQNQNGNLVNVSKTSGAGVALFSMGLACGDFDNNGWPDLYCTNIPGGGDMDNPLLLNQDGINFVESGVEAGVDNPITSWGSIFFDFDNDGNQDLYVNNMFQANTFYLNSGTFPSIEIAAAAGLQANSGVSFSAAVADVDGDGDIDLLVNNLSNNVELFINNEGDNRRWIRYKVIGSGNNTWAIGANVDTKIGETQQYREIYAGGNGYLGQNELVIHVGVDDALVVDEAVVNWPGGKISRTLTNIPTNQTWKIYPPSHLGDADGDGVVGVYDFFVFEFFFNGPIEPGCEMMDFDGNSYIDMADFDSFLAVYSFELLDCNGNAEFDLTEILMDPDLDMDETGILDICENLGDLDGSGSVGTSDLLVLLAGWGICNDCSQCPADLDDNCSAGTSDLLILLSNWGETF